MLETNKIDGMYYVTDVKTDKMVASFFYAGNAKTFTNDMEVVIATTQRDLPTLKKLRDHHSWMDCMQKGNSKKKKTKQ